MNRGCYAQIYCFTVSFNCIHSVRNKCLLRAGQDKTTLFYQGSPVSCKAGILRGPEGKKKAMMHDACIFHIKNTILFFFSNYCTLLLKNCTCNLFCQQLMNKEKKMRIYLYLFENGCISASNANWSILASLSPISPAQACSASSAVIIIFFHMYFKPLQRFKRVSEHCAVIGWVRK